MTSKQIKNYYTGLSRLYHYNASKPVRDAGFDEFMSRSLHTRIRNATAGGSSLDSGLVWSRIQLIARELSPDAV